MKRFGLLLLCTLVCITCGGKQAYVEKTIENGVEVVLNHLEPYMLRGEAYHIKLTEITKIDFEESAYSELGLKEPSITETDGSENIYVVEGYPDSQYFIYKFSPDGAFLKKFGPRGQGPGEIQSVDTLIVKKNGNVQVSDRETGKLIEYDTEGKCIKEIKVHHVIREVTLLENGYYLGRRNAKDPSESRGMYLCLFDAEFNELKKLDSVDMPDVALGKGTSGTIISFLWQAIGDRIYVANEQRGYEILVYDLEGKLLRKIRKEYRPVPYPDDFRRQTEKLAIRQPNLNLFARKDMPPFNSFFLDDEGRLFVMTYEKGANPDDYIHDVFNRDGILIARVPLGKYGILGRVLNSLRATATNGRLCRMRFKEDGYPELIIYSMQWE